MACESVGETSKRKAEESDSAVKKRRSNGSDTLNYLREKGEKEQEIRQNEINLKKEELQLRRLEIETNRDQNQQLIAQMMAQNQQMLLFLTSMHTNQEQ